MAIPLSTATPPRKKDEERAKLNAGRHIVRCLDVREYQTRNAGLGFFADFEVVEGPTQKGFKDSFCVCPENARTNGKLTLEQVKNLEYGKIQVAVAAIAGYVKEACGIVDDQFYERAIGEEERKKDKTWKSGLAGSLFEVEAVPYTGKKGATVYYEVFPHLDAKAHADTAAVQTKTEAAPATKAPPPAPKKAAPFPPSPWVVHPSDEMYVWNEQTDEVIEASELKQRLAA
jgi:hypothetical protein